MEQNKTGKYLKYAIGEIVLVVIGILIALSINNWNNIRQLKADNKIVLKKMIYELELNKTRMTRLSRDPYNNNKTSLLQAIKNCDSLIKLSYIGLNETHLDFIYNNSPRAIPSKLTLHNSVFEELINTGKLYTIGSDSLITNIKNYYKKLERETEYNIDNTNRTSDGFKLMKMGLTKLKIDYYRMDSVNFNIKNYPWYFNSSSEHYQNMQLGLIDMRQGQHQNLIKMRGIIRWSDALINVIKKELKIDD